MDNFDYIKYLKNNPLLSEIKINTPGGLSEQDIKDIETLTEYFGEGQSGFSLHNPMDEEYNLDNIEDGNDDDRFEAFKNLTSKYNKTFLVNNIPSFNYFTFVRAPKNSFIVKIIITPDSVHISVPHVDNEGEYYTGWFDNNGKYHGDVDNFNEDGNYIQNK